MSQPTRPAPDVDGPQYWETRYQAESPDSSGNPGALLRQCVESLRPGRALELGCARGDDAVWLTKRGWTVLAVDISRTVLGYAAVNARTNGVEAQIAFERHDLAFTFPEGRFDLITASFLQSPVAFPREDVLRRAAAAVAPGGYLLIAEHASGPSWKAAPHSMEFPVLEHTCAVLGLDDEWTSVRVETLERPSIGPEGEQGTRQDNLIFVRRK